jgi:alpha-L-rhamnosidase
MPHARRRAAILAAVVTLSTVVSPAAQARAAAPVSLSGAHWIWYPEGDPHVSAPAAYRYFRKSFSVASGAVSDAQLVVTGDDTVDVWLNGKPLAASPRGTDAWKTALYVDLGAAIAAGTNTLAIAAHNTTAGPAGLVGHVHVVTAAGTTDLSTDGSWKTSQTAPAGWSDPGFNDASWPASTDLGAYGVGPWNADVAAPDTAAASPLTVAAATVEHKANPLGIDTTKPLLGWQLAAPKSQLRQGAYQVVVDGPAGTVWDSGRVASQQSVDVAYGGPALASLTRYTWRIRAWDGQGRAGAWSATQSFETGLLSPATEWQADYIGRAAGGADLSGANWIWYPEGDPANNVPAGTRYFRRTVSLASAPASATLVVTGDDTADAWVNGTKVAASPRITDSWKTAATIDVAKYLRAGNNTVAIATENTSASPASAIAKLTVQGGPTVVTDAAWKTSQTGPSGWEQPAFDDSSWVAARVVAAYGGGQWGGQVLVPKPSPLLRKTFTVSKAISSARLLSTALGLQETRLNGARVGDDVLAPGWTDYGKRLQYKEYDVTGQVRQGDNVLGAMLGNGWFSGNIGFAGTALYGTQPWYSALLRITYTDGSSSTVKTDGTWKTATGAIRFDDLYAGEEYDARAERTGWDAAGYDESGWSAALVRTDARPNLVSQVDNGVRVQQEFKPVAITQPKSGVWVLDLGQNFAGWDRLKVSGAAGTTVTIRHAEVLNPDGTIYTDNLRGARATDKYTLKGGGTETYSPRFTQHGYRYVELTGFPGTPTVDSLTGLAAWTSAPQIGTLNTSNSLVNQLQHNIVWGERSNLLSVPSDCPQRDERLGWTGDINSFAATSTFNLDAHTFLDKFTDDLTDAQRSDGAFTDVAPFVSAGSGTAGWGDAGVTLPYTLWQRYGDTRVIDEHFTAMTRWVDYLKSTSDSDLIRRRDTYGDWLNVGDETDKFLISTAYVSRSARLVSWMAAATGRTADAMKYGTIADQVAAAFASHYIASDGTVSGNTQTGYVLALAFGLTPANLVQPAVDKLVAKVAASGGHLTVGFLGVENLLPVLTEHGHADTAYQILLQPGFPGWGYQISRGATTIWERWDGINPDGTFNTPTMNSFNHYGLGSVGDFLYRSVGGLGPASPGYRSLLIAPKPGGGLTSAKASLNTPYGTAVSDWSMSGSALTLRVTVPAGSSATVQLPNAATGVPAEATPLGGNAYYVPAGSYTFTA